VSHAKRDIPTVQVQLLPPSPHPPSIDAKEMLRKMVEQQVAAIMSRRDEFNMQPFFAKKKIADELKRYQTVPEQKKWRHYFDRYGCLRCETRDVNHASCGMCARCYAQVGSRLKTVYKQLERDSPDDPPADFDNDELARQALLPAPKSRRLR
jgi:protein-arginine kinase activator protein McsA